MTDTMGTPGVGMGVIHVGRLVEMAHAMIPGAVVTVATSMVDDHPDAVVVFTTYGDGTVHVERAFGGIANGIEPAYAAALRSMADHVFGAIGQPGWGDSPAE